MFSHHFFDAATRHDIQACHDLILKAKVKQGENSFSSDETISLNETIFFLIKENHLNILRLLAETFTLNFSKIWDEHGDLPIHCAIKSNLTHICLYLLEQNPGLIEEVDSEGNTPLMLAIQSKDKYSINKIMQSGLCNEKNISTANYEGYTALHLACANQDESLCQQLISLNANVNAINKMGDSAINVNRQIMTNIRYKTNFPFHALLKNCDSISSFLMQANLEDLSEKLDAQDNELNTLLHLAAQKNQLELVVFLVQKGANIHLTNDKQLTPVAMTTDPEIQKFLNNKNFNERMAYGFELFKNNPEVINALTSIGVGAGSAILLMYCNRNKPSEQQEHDVTTLVAENVLKSAGAEAAKAFVSYGMKNCIIS